MRKILPILIGLLLVSVVSAYAVSTGNHVMPMEQRGTGRHEGRGPVQSEFRCPGGHVLVR